MSRIPHYLAKIFYRMNRADKLWNLYLRTREELLLLLGNDAFFRAYNEVAYTRSRSYAPLSSSFRDRLFKWEIDAIEDYFPPVPGRVLIGGAGGGREAFDLCRRGYRVTAFEPAVHLVGQMLHHARERKFDMKVYAGGYEQFIGREENLALPACTVPHLPHLSSLGVFDAILLGWGSLTHVRNARDRQLLFAECYGMLTSGGCMLASYWGAPQQSTCSRSLSRRALEISKNTLRRAGGNEINDRFYTHVGFGHQFSNSEIRKLAGDAGFEVLYMSNEEGGEYPHCVLKKTDPS